MRIPDRRVNVWLQRRNNTPMLQMEWFDPETGQRKSKSTGTSDATAAEKIRGDKEYELNHGLHAEPSKMPWSDFRQRYEREKGGAETTLQKVAYVFDGFEALVKPQTIGHVTERMISRYATAMREKGHSPSTISGYLAYIKAALNWAAGQRIIHEAPKIVCPSIPKGVSRSKIRAAARITDADFQRLLEHAPTPGWKLLIAFAWHCGLRRCEAMEVCGQNIDLERHTVLIPSNKGNDADAAAIIPPALDAMLRRTYPDGIPNGRLITDVPADERVVSNEFRRKIATAAKVLGGGLGGLCTLHDLRRNYGSRWAAKVPAQVLQRMMRHANISTTMSYYADAELAAVGAVWAESERCESQCESQKKTPKSGKRKSA